MIHLHLHSTYSPLDGLSKIPDIIKEVKSQGRKAVAITDHASISCLPEFLKEAKKEEINPIIGCEFYLAETKEGVNKEKRYHLTVWAKNWQGVESIMRQLTLANKQFYHRPRLTFQQALDFKDCFIGTACCFGILAHDNYEYLYREFVDTYNQDLFLEMMPHVVMSDDGMVDLQKKVNDRAIELKKKYAANLLLTNDAHYVKKSDRETHRLLLSIQYHKSFEEFQGWGDGFHVRNQEEMIIESIKAGIPQEYIQEAIENTYHIAKQVKIEKPKYKISLPDIYIDSDDAFSRIVLEGWNNKIDKTFENYSVYFDRMVYEITVIKNMGFVKYFLIVHDVISWARSQGIMVGIGRGSCAGSLICYLMGITGVDPIKHGLFFERFLNVERVENPDIDTDFQDDRREEVFNYLTNKYGKDKTAFINTFSYLSAKSAFRDVARAYNVPNMQVNELSKQIETMASFDEVSELINFKSQYPDVISHIERLDGVIRQVGVNASGFIISDIPLEQVCVLERRKNIQRGDEFFVTNWDKRESESFGLLKVDILGLSTLTVLNYARELVRQRTGRVIQFNDIDLEDEKVINLFKAGNTIGIFQFESDSMRQLLTDMNLSTFQEIVHATALFRPGSLQSGQTARYVKIVNGKSEEYYPDERLRPILDTTKSVLVYQEQVIQIFNKLGGFTLAEADQMRKIIGKKLGYAEFEKHREHFVQGCLSNGISKDVANSLFTDMVEFAAYSFNLSHSVSYTITSFWSAYLKVYYPIEFYTASLSSTDDNDRAFELIKDAKQYNIQVVPPNINVSTDRYTIGLDGNITYPLSAIKGVGTKAVDAILEARKEGLFTGIDDLINRVNKRACNSRIISSLIDVGAFDSFGGEIPTDRHQKALKLISGFTDIPEISLLAADTDRINNTVSHIENTYIQCASICGKNPILPHITNNYSGVMVINNINKKQKAILSGDSSKYFIGLLKKAAINIDSVFYTSALKCNSEIKSCKTKCYDYLSKEIELSQPKFIICMSTDALALFTKEKMVKVNGKILYNEKYNAYIMPCYSPQYALYKGGNIQEDFENNILKLKEIFIHAN